MNFLLFFEWFIYLLFSLTMITQVIIPLWNDVPMFPIFNSSRRDLETAITTVHELQEQQKLTDELKTKTETLLSIKKEK